MGILRAVKPRARHTCKLAPRAARRARAPHVERAYRNLKAGIVEGRYRPGASLSEVGLASEHGMSRTPIREGLARLWQEGYLDRVVGHGYFVARVTVQQIHDTFDVRRLLEGRPRRARPSWRRPKTLSGSAGSRPCRSARRRTIANRRAANVQFHLAIARCARNGLALELIERCLAQVDRFMSLGVNFGPFRRGRPMPTSPIVDAIARRDADGARLRMEQHLDVGSQLMKDALMRGQIAGVGLG